MNCANHPDRERKAFCQNCGKPICVECARTIGQAVFCEPCLELRLAAANTAAAQASQPSPAGSTGYTSVPNSEAGSPFPGNAGIPYGTPAKPASGTPNPMLALILGFCPGVGAMYNGQLAKGIVHLIIFAVLCSLSDQHGIFGILIAAWVFYQAFEAYHTALALRDGTPLPNAFGLNDIGERFGFNRPAGSIFGSSVPPTPGSTVPPPYTRPVSYTEQPYAQPEPSRPAASAYTATEPPVWNTVTDPAGVPVAPAVQSGRSFPTGALILIGLGVLFLLGNTHMFVGLPLQYLLPVVLIGIGVYIFVRKMTASGVSLADDGSVAYRLRLVSALRSSVWVILVGVLFLLDDLNILVWSRSWPLFIILGGVMAFVQRSAYAAVAAQAIPGPGYSSPSPTPVVPAADAPGTALVPRDREEL